MKKVLIVALLASAFAVGWHPSITRADPFQYAVRGYVRDNGSPVANAKVHFACMGYNGRATTDIHGFFNITFAPDMCKGGSNLFISATAGDKYKELRFDSTGNVTTVYIDLAPTVQVPEYGWLAGAASGGAAIGVVAFVRRRSKVLQGGK